MFTPEAQQVLAAVNSLPTLQDFEASGLDVNAVAVAAFDWSGEKKSTKPVVKALARALQATSDVEGVTVSRYAQGVEMLSFAAACAPLLDSDRLARLIEVASQSSTAYQPLGDVYGTSQVLSQLLAGVAPQRRLQVLTDLWRTAHEVSFWTPLDWDSLKAKMKSGWLRSDEKPSGAWVLPEEASHLEWWYHPETATLLDRVLSQDPASAPQVLDVLVQGCCDLPVSVFHADEDETYEVVSVLVYALQAHAGVVHSAEDKESVADLLSDDDPEYTPYYNGIVAFDGFARNLSISAFQALLEVGDSTASLSEAVTQRSDIADLREAVRGLVQEEVLSPLTWRDMNELVRGHGHGVLHLLASDVMERIFASSTLDVQLFFLTDDRIPLATRRQVLLSSRLAELDPSARSRVLKGLDILSPEEGVGLYLGTDPDDRHLFFQHAPCAIWLGRFMEAEKDVETLALNISFLASNSRSWAWELLAEHARSVTVQVVAEAILNSFIRKHSMFSASRFDGIDPQVFARLLRLLSPEAARRILRGAYRDDHLLGDETWEWAVRVGAADLSHLGSYAADLVTTGRFDDPDLAEYLGSNEPDVIKVLATRLNAAPAARPTSSIARAIGRLAPALAAEGVTMPARPATWADYAQLEDLRVYSYPERLEALDGAILPGVGSALRLVRDSSQLKRNAEHMGNCTAGYADDAADGTWAVFQLTYDDVEHNASIEVDDDTFTVGEINTRFNQGGVAFEVEEAFEALVARLND